MRILNIMLGRNRGGLEQAAVDYHDALVMKGHDVISVIHPDAAIGEPLQSLGGRIETIKPLGEWDPFATSALRRLAVSLEADVAIGHGNRAIGLALKALKGRVPVIGVAHNYHIKKRFPQCDGIFCITRDLIEEMVHLDIGRDKLRHIPNMIHTFPVPKRTEFHAPLVIGSMGRFVEKKGFDSYLHTLKALKDLGVSFKAVLGGGGELESELRALATEFDLNDHLTFTGWVSDKDQFFSDIDVFVLPSYHEPFGIVLIEAMAAGLPCITTDTEGPCEIIKDRHDAIMVEKAKPYQMAAEIRDLAENPSAAFDMGYYAHLKVRDRYDIALVSDRLDMALQQLVPTDNHPI